MGIFTDGSYFPQPRDKAGGAIVFPSGQVWTFRPSGKQACYKAELPALVLASVEAFPHEFIWTDSQGCLKAIEGTNPRALFRGWINSVRNLWNNKHIMLSHVQWHIGVLGNEIADKYAKLPTMLPNNPTQIPREPWDIMVQGEKVGGPHKTWGRVHIPTHQQKNVHSLSFSPIKKGDFRWIKWLYAMRYVPGYANPRSYWIYAGRGGVYVINVMSNTIYRCMAILGIVVHPRRGSKLGA